MAMHKIALVLAFALSTVSTVNACVHTYTYNDELHIHRHLLQASPQYSYESAGADWGDLSDTWATCGKGETQTPINVDISLFQRPPTTASWRTDFADLGSITNVRVINTGHALQVEWDWARKPNATVQVYGSKFNDLFHNDTSNATPVSVPFTPIQFHFHTFSEHWYNGAQFAAEGHIVATISNTSLPACNPQCLMVIGIFYRLGDENPTLKTFFDAVPGEKGAKNNLTNVDSFELSSLLPARQSYVTYEGSLTTPPCTEGLRWHVLTQPQTMSWEQVAQLQAVAAGDTGIPTNARHPQPINGRPLYFVL